MAVKKFEKHHDTDTFTLVLSQKQDKLDRVSFDQGKPKTPEPDDSPYSEPKSQNIKEKKIDDAPKPELTKAPRKTKFTYKNNPMENPKASADIIENPDAIYRFSSNPHSSRIGKFSEYDWTEPNVVAKAREARIAYHKDNETIYNTVESMRVEGKSSEEIARATNKVRNENRLQSYIDRGNMEGYYKAIESNIKNYGNELGISAEQAYERYGSWEKVIEKTMSTNAGMDACCGLYDDYYHLYGIN